MYILVISRRDAIDGSCEWHDDRFDLDDLNRSYDMDLFNSHVMRCRSLIKGQYLTGAAVLLCHGDDQVCFAWSAGFGKN